MLFWFEAFRDLPINIYSAAKQIADLLVVTAVFRLHLTPGYSAAIYLVPKKKLYSY